MKAPLHCRVRAALDAAALLTSSARANPLRALSHRTVLLLGLCGMGAAPAAGAPPATALPAWIDEVGATATPAAPGIFSANAFGASSDGVTPATGAIQAAIDAAAAAGGGTVTYAPGRYLTGALFLKSHVHLRIDKGVTLLGSHDEKAYPLLPTRVAGIEMTWPAALINVDGQKDVEIFGGGTIDGQGEFWWKKYWDLRRDYEPRDIRWAADYDCQRVRLMVIWNSANVTVAGLHLCRSGFWTVQITYSDHVTVDGIKITDNSGPSTDGVDIDSSRRVLVQHCDIDNNDDDICLKAGRDTDGLRVNRPTEYVVIRDNVCRRGAGVVSFGSETSGGIRHIVAYRDTGIGTSEGIRFKTARTRGGVVEDVLIRDITLTDVPRPFTFTLNWDPAYSYARIPAAITHYPDYWKVLAARVEPPEKGYVDFRDITIAAITATGADRILTAEGMPEKALGAVRWENIRARGRQAGLVQDARDWTLRSVLFTTDDGQPLRLVRCENVDSPTVVKAGAVAAGPFAWPEATFTTRPWTRWWWLGSAVDAPNLQRLLTLYRQAGLGGVEICPIYGARGYESRFIDYLSPKWMDMFAITTATAKRLGLGVDLTTGTGWPMGGPWVTPRAASAGVVLQRFAVDGGTAVSVAIPVPQLQALVAAGPDGRSIDLTPQVHDGRLAWNAPAGAWRLYAVGQKRPLQKVKRAAPGGEGKVLDPFSTQAMDLYLARFDEAFRGYHGPAPRAEFQDSYEYYGANWTGDLFEQFSRRRGYDLRTQLPAFFGEGDADTIARVKYDYRLTLAELHQAYVARWTEWSHAHGSLTREQAHGSPTNLEDVYATADIPETEASFGGVAGADQQLPMMQFASSAAHVTGRTLASSETFTWLGEHFQVPLSQLKPTVDFFFIAGINHIFFHGIPYSPADAPWPGWLFYAAVNLGPEGGLWHDLPSFNAYATRCQSILQSGRPANDLLLYFPVADFWQKSGKERDAASTAGEPAKGLIEQFTTPGKWMANTPFHDTAMELWHRGFSFDEVTDHFIAEAKMEDGALRLGGNPYRAILLPPTRLLPVETLRELVALARKGATILVQGTLPDDVPGLEHLAERRREYREALAQIDLRDLPGTVLRQARIGRGTFLVGGDLAALLTQARVVREAMADAGLRCIRRRETDGFDYFIANPGKQAVDGWITLGTPAVSAAILDPLWADRAGAATLRRDAAGASQIYLQLQPGESRLVRTRAAEPISGAPWPYEKPADGAVQTVAGDWQVRFTEGGPALPHDYRTRALSSWTTRDDPEAKRFAGTAVYRIEFDFQPGGARDWLLDLGRVCESARVRLNGNEVTTLWCAPFSTAVGRFLRAGRNVLELEVTNVAANRIADLDRRHVNWKSFYEINFVNRDYLPFDASAWPLRDSGLLGPVTLHPLAEFDPNP